MDRSQKHDLVASLHETFMKTALVVVSQQAGMTVAEVTNLRRQMRDAGAGFKVTKNSLTKLALEGTKFEGLSSLFTGPTAIAFSEDPVAAAKVSVAYAKTSPKLVIIGGAIGEQMLAPEAVTALATLPSLDELRARLLGMIQTPATRIAGVLQAPAAQLARVLSAYATKDQATDQAA